MGYFGSLPTYNFALQCRDCIAAKVVTPGARYMCSSGHIEGGEPGSARSAPKVCAGKDTNRIVVDVVFASKTRGHGAIFFFSTFFMFTSALLRSLSHVFLFAPPQHVTMALTFPEFLDLALFRRTDLSARQ